MQVSPYLPCPAPPQLCLHRVCHRELGPGCRGTGQECLPRPGHQGVCPPPVTARRGVGGSALSISVLTH